jgi:hypothetical protein
MVCPSDLDALEIARRHLKAYTCKRVNFYYSLSEYREAMSHKSFPEISGEYPQNHKHHRPVRKEIQSDDYGLV